MPSFIARLISDKIIKIGIKRRDSGCSVTEDSYLGNILIREART